VNGPDGKIRSGNKPETMMRTLRIAARAKTVLAAVALVALVCLPGGSVPARAAGVPEYSATIVKTYPHDPQAFTEGLLYHDGFLYESTGREGQSSIRKVVLDTGAVVQEHSIGKQYFGEGIVIWDNRLIELTWKSQIGFVYDAATFTQLSEFHYAGEGWALTRDALHIYMSDGTADLRVLDPVTLAESSRIHVTCDGKPIKNINELEWVKGEIYANIWLTNIIARINPGTGEVVGTIDLTDLRTLASTNQAVDVVNGIAYDATGDRLFVTGKLWPSLYQITQSARPDGRDLCPALY
jgi:glutamine cyclotransferase